MPERGNVVDVKSGFLQNLRKMTVLTSIGGAVANRQGQRRAEYARSLTSVLRSEFCPQPHQRKHVHELGQGGCFAPFRRR